MESKKKVKRSQWLDLFEASRKGNSVKVERLLGVKSVDVGFQNVAGHTALMNAVGYGFLRYRDRAKVVKLLLGANGVNVNAVNKQRNTALSIASYYGHFKIVKLLLARGADAVYATQRLKAMIHYRGLFGGIKQALENWKRYLPVWTTKTHKYYPADFKEAVKTWLLVVQTQKQIKKCVNKDMRVYMISFITAAYRLIVVQTQKQIKNCVNTDIRGYMIPKTVKKLKTKEGVL